MSSSSVNGRLQPMPANNYLAWVAKAWIAVVLVGQMLFALYIVAVYVFPTLVGQTDITREVLPGTGTQNLSNFDSGLFFMHIVPAAVMAVSGLLQLLPSIRSRYPKLHRYNGRLFFTLGLSGALSGLYLTWVSGLRFSDIGSLGVTLNGILIVVFIALAWRTAIKRKFADHRRFAVHAYITVNGVFSFRLYLMAWYLINQGPNGNSRLVDGPMDITLSFASYLLPMLIAELVFWGQRTKQQPVKWGVSAVASAGLIYTIIGVGAAATMMLGPRLQAVAAALL